MKTLLAICAAFILATQIVTANFASAAPGSADLNINYSSLGWGNSVYAFRVCNEGDEIVTSFSVEIDTQNWNFEFALMTDNQGNDWDATDVGEFDSNTMTWSGVVELDQCVDVNMYGEVVGALGESASFSAEIVSSVLQGDIENIDPVSENNSVSIGPTEIVDQPDLAVNARLLTQGEIIAGTEVEYEVILSNVGLGPLMSSGMNVAFIVPPNATYDEVVDADLGDGLSINMCFPFGTPSNVGPGLADVEGNIVVCLLEGDEFLDPGSSFPFTFSMTATEEFSTGEVSAYVSTTGNEAESARVQVDIAQGINPIVNGYNNIRLLPYNNEDLVPTINRCPGQGFLTLNGTGCFRITFNKEIWAPEFTQSDLVLNGGGTITGFSQIDDSTWEVIVSDIPRGATVTLSILEGSVLDYSAIENGVLVLGENAIRFESEAAQSTGDGTATGTLPATGSETLFIFYIALIAITTGYALKRLCNRTTS